MCTRKKVAALLVVGMCLLVTSRLWAAEEAARPTPLTEYQKLVEQVKGLSEEELAKFDFGKLRKAFFETGALDPVSRELEDSLNKAIAGDRHQQVAEIAAQILAVDYTDARAHLFKALAHKKLAQPKEYTFHMTVSQGLLQSIVKTGDGRSPQTAWQVYQVKEEYHLLQYRFGISDMVEQKLLESGGKQYDMLRVRTQQGQTLDLYFDVTDHMKRIMEQLVGKER